MEHLVKARAHENQYFFVAVDRTGSDPNTSYYGTNIIANPYAEDVAKHEGIYRYAEITKDDIVTLHKFLPLDGSFKKEYTSDFSGRKRKKKVTFLDLVLDYLFPPKLSNSMGAALGKKHRRKRFYILL